jgi:hypothetical protein
MRPAAYVALGLLAACRAPVSVAPRPLALPAAFADSVRSERIGPDVTLHTIVNTKAPWRAYVLDVELTRCNAVQAVKGARTAVGRSTTSALLGSLPASANAIAAVNADFFLFAPPGVPTNAHIERGTLISGPDNRPVFYAGAGDVRGFDTLFVKGTLRSARGTIALNAWNRPAVRTAGVLDARWHVAPDSLVRRRVWRLDPLTRTKHTTGPAFSGRYVVRTWRDADSLVSGDTLLLHLPANAALAPVAGDTVFLDVAIAHRNAAIAGPVLHAVGGRPMLVADSAVARDADTEGQDSFRGLNPRTAMGFDRSGRRLFLAVIDGRRPGNTMGMSLHSTADLLLALGATRGINLDGGGSSALVLRDLATGAQRVVNRPSDNVERAVANGLVVTAKCGR